MLSWIELKFEKSIEILDDIINCQSSPNIRIGLGSNKNQKAFKENSKTSTTKPPKKVNEEKPKSYVDVLKSSIKNEGNKKKENDVSQKHDLPHKDNDEFRRSFTPKWPCLTWHQNSFFGYCFSCNHFGHKAIDCRTYEKK